MKDKLIKFKYTGIAIIVATILGIAGGKSDSNTDVTKKIAATTETTTVKSNQILAEKSDDKSVTKENVTIDNKSPETTKDNNDSLNNNNNSKNKNSLKKVVSPKNYSGKPYVIINDNKPSFSKKEITKKSYETYSKLDSYGRCGVAMACVGRDIMPTEERGSIGRVKPSGWHTVKYDCVDGKYLYNRCHLIGYQLTGENANEKNLITGTRYLNVDGMLPFENLVADYVKETNNHVMYRVIPIYEGDNMLASGVEMEAYSVEDNGDGVSFHVYCYNVQPGVKIDYKNGDSSLDESAENSK